MGSGREERDRDRGQVAPRPARGGGRAPGPDHRWWEGRLLPDQAERLVQVRGFPGEDQGAPLKAGSGVGPAGRPLLYYGAVAAWMEQPAAFISSSACMPVSAFTGAQRLTRTRTWNSCLRASRAVARTQ